MRKKRILPMLVAVMLLCAIAVSVAAAGLTGPEKVDDAAVAAFDKPKVTVVGNQVTNAAGYFELSLQVSAKKFQSAGVVLTYDATVLTPVDWQKDGVPIDLTGHTDWGTATVAYTKGLDGMSSKPALICKPEDSNTGWLYLGSDTLEYTNLLNERVVTVRFKIADGKTVDFPGTTVQTATTDAILTDSATGATLQTSVGPGPVFYSSKEDPTYTVDFLQDDGPSIDKGGSSAASGGYAITFFDWDGRVIDAISAPANATDAVAAWREQEAIKNRLGNKKGYEFETWIVVQQVDEKLVSAHKDLTSRKSTTGVAPADAANFSDLSQYVTDPSKSVLVQAAYKTTSDVNSGRGDDGNLNDDTARYQFGTPSFYQYGPSADANNGQYAVRVPVTRGEPKDSMSLKSGVLRANEPVIYAVVTTPSGAVIEKVVLENTDMTQFEVVVPKTTVSVTYMVLDSYGEDAWTLGLQRSQEGRQVKATIIKEGAFALLVNEGWLYKENDWDLVKTPVNDVCFRDAGYTKVNASNLTAARTALSKASKDNNGVLDRAKADAALAAYK